jgi:hypothetical protein
VPLPAAGAPEIMTLSAVALTAYDEANTRIANLREPNALLVQAQCANIWAAKPTTLTTRAARDVLVATARGRPANAGLCSHEKFGIMILRCRQPKNMAIAVDVTCSCTLSLHAACLQSV